MENLSRIRFMAANYPNLQGLKQVPFGIMAVLVSLWGNAIRKPATDLTFPILVAVVWAIRRALIDAWGQLRNPEQPWLGSLSSDVRAPP